MRMSLLDAVKGELAKLRPSDFLALAAATGVPEGTIRKIHYGEVADPRVGTVQRLHDHFFAARHPRQRGKAACG